MIELQRLDHNVLEVGNDYGVPARLFANEQVPLEPEALTQLEHVLELQRTVQRISEREDGFCSDPEAAILAVAVTPDFHKGPGIPIGTVLLTRGFVVPQLVGKDINCGMRLHLTELRESQVTAASEQLERRIRSLFFEGGRQIPLRRSQRRALLERGLVGLLETATQAGGVGLWAHYDRDEQERDLQRVLQGGSSPTDRVDELDDYLGSDELTYDGQIGSIGGGNHFVEVQVVRQVLDGSTAFAWGLRPGRVVVMVHSGCVSIGHPTGLRFAAAARSGYPDSLKHPVGGLYPLAEGERHGERWRDFFSSYANAVNFAYGNRLFLALMMRRALSETVGETDYPLLWDAGHNIITREEVAGAPCYLHRKGATPAHGLASLPQPELAYHGEPVLIPGSMGAPSFVLAGCGNPASLWSASHGAGRALSRGAAQQVDEQRFREFLARFRIVTPLDPKRPDLRGRRDILAKWETALKEEAPYAYKAIGPIIETQVGAGLVRPVAELAPLLTVKG